MGSKLNKEGMRTGRADGQREGGNWGSGTLDMVWIPVVIRADRGEGWPGRAEGKVAGQR